MVIKNRQDLGNEGCTGHSGKSPSLEVIQLLCVPIYHIVNAYNINIIDITIVLKDIFISFRLSLVSFRLSHEAEDIKKDDMTEGDVSRRK